MRYLKQSTSVDVGIGPFLDESDGKTAETTLTITQPDVRLKKNNGNWAQKAAAQTLSHEENGWYEVTLDTTDTDTIGILLVAVHESGALPVWMEFHVLAANVYDSLFGAATDKLQVDLVEMVGVSQSATDLKDFADDGYDPATNKVQGVVLVDTLTTYTGNTPQTGDSFARLGAPAGASVSADIAAIEAQTDDIGAAGAGLTAIPDSAGTTTLLSRLTALRAGYLDNLSAGAVATAAALATAAGEVTSILGKFTGITLLAQWLGLIAGKQTGDATARTEIRATGAGSGTYDETTDALEANRDNQQTAAAAALTAYDPPTRAEATSDKDEILTRAGTPAGASVSADIAAVKAQTAAIETDTQDLQGRVPAALAGGNMKCDVLAVNGSANAAARHALAAAQIIPATVDNTGHAPTTTEFEADDITEATADHFNGCVVIWTTGALAGQRTEVSDYSLVGGRGHFTVVAMTEAPANNDTFVLV